MESEPCTEFSPTLIPYKYLIVPLSALTGLVAPVKPLLPLTKDPTSLAISADNKNLYTTHQFYDTIDIYEINNNGNAAIKDRVYIDSPTLITISLDKKNVYVLHQGNIVSTFNRDLNTGLLSLFSSVVIGSSNPVFHKILVSNDNKFLYVLLTSYPNTSDPRGSSTYQYFPESINVYQKNSAGKFTMYSTLKSTGISLEEHFLDMSISKDDKTLYALSASRRDDIQAVIISWDRNSDGNWDGDRSALPYNTSITTVPKKLLDKKLKPEERYTGNVGNNLNILAISPEGETIILPIVTPGQVGFAHGRFLIGFDKSVCAPAPYFSLIDSDVISSSTENPVKLDPQHIVFSSNGLYLCVLGNIYAPERTYSQNTRMKLLVFYRKTTETKSPFVKISDSDLSIDSRNDPYDMIISPDNKKVYFILYRSLSGSTQDSGRPSAYAPPQNKRLYTFDLSLIPIPASVSPLKGNISMRGIPQICDTDKSVLYGSTFITESSVYAGMSIYNRNQTTGGLNSRRSLDANTKSMNYPVLMSPSKDYIYYKDRPNNQSTDFIYIYKRNLTTGDLIHVNDIDTGTYISKILIFSCNCSDSPDGTHIYAIGEYSKQITIFTRNIGTGDLVKLATVDSAVPAAKTIDLCFSTGGRYMYDISIPEYYSYNSLSYDIYRWTRETNGSLSNKIPAFENNTSKTASVYAPREVTYLSISTAMGKDINGLDKFLVVCRGSINFQYELSVNLEIFFIGNDNKLSNATTLVSLQLYKQSIATASNLGLMSLLVSPDAKYIYIFLETARKIITVSVDTIAKKAVVQDIISNIDTRFPVMTVDGKYIYCLGCESVGNPKTCLDLLSFRREI